jgi:hypothetical protein
MIDRLLLLASLALIALGACATDGEAPPASPAFVQAQTPEEAGHYLFLAGGCNDCHTPGWQASDGKLPEAEWGLGSATGFRGPWGTSYAANLRLVAAELTERQWVLLFRQSSGAPPMPWMNYRTMSEGDLVALQRFLERLGSRGAAAPDLVPPGKEPTTPYIDMTPRAPAAHGP